MAPKTPAPDPVTLPSFSSLSSYSPERAWRGTVAWFDAHAVEIVIAVACGIAIYLLLALVRNLVAKLKNRGAEHPALATLIGRAAARTSQFFMVMTAAKLVSGYANPPAQVANTIGFLFTLAAVFQGAVWLRELILGLIERRSQEDGHGETLGNALGIIRLLVTVVLFAVASIVVLDNVGVNVTGLVAGLGVGGIAIGLAAQGIFSDLFAALSIIFDKPFRLGETIHYDTTTATVERIGLKSTRLRAVTGERKVISNANLLQKEITSYQTLDHRRVRFPIGVVYQTDPDAAAAIPEVLREIVERSGGHFVRSGFVGFGASSLDFELEFDVYKPSWDEIYRVRHAVGVEILRRFNRDGLAFAYPTQTSYTAAPDGRLVMPYAEPAEPAEPAAPTAVT